MPTPYTTSAALSTTMSASGLQLRSDDDSNAVTQAIADASVEIDGYCLLNYSALSLAASAWVEKKARDLAVFQLASRRLNPIPQSVQAKYETAIQQLQQVKAGSMTIPDAAINKGNVPILSNVRIRMTPVPHSDVERGRSTGTPEGYLQFSDPTEPYFDYTLVLPWFLAFSLTLLGAIVC